GRGSHRPATYDREEGHELGEGDGHTTAAKHIAMLMIRTTSRFTAKPTGPSPGTRRRAASRLRVQCAVGAGGARRLAPVVAAPDGERRAGGHEVVQQDHLDERERL